MKIFIKTFAQIKNLSYLCTRKSNGAIAQLVEQRTENPCVPGSIPGGTTARNANNLQNKLLAFFLLLQILNLATFDQQFDTFCSSNPNLKRETELGTKTVRSQLSINLVLRGVYMLYTLSGVNCEFLAQITPYRV